MECCTLRPISPTISNILAAALNNPPSLLSRVVVVRNFRSLLSRSGSDALALKFTGLSFEKFLR